MSWADEGPVVTVVVRCDPVVRGPDVAPVWPVGYELGRCIRAVAEGVAGEDEGGSGAAAIVISLTGGRGPFSVTTEPVGESWKALAGLAVHRGLLSLGLKSFAMPIPPSIARKPSTRAQMRPTPASAQSSGYGWRSQ